MGVTAHFAVFALAVAGFATACSGTDEPSTIPTPSGTAAITGAARVVVPIPSAGCGSSSTAGESEGTLTSGGLERTYLLHVPPAYDGGTPMPLVVNLHGFGSNASDQMRYSRFNPLADDEGFIVVAPNGSGTPQRWTFPGLGTVDDVSFIGELIDELAGALCIDETRIYAAGMSNGAAISTFVPCGLPGRIAAIAAVGATAGPRTCGNDVTVPVITFRGTEDACVPYDGGTSSCGMMLPVVSAEEVARLWGEHNGCTPEPAAAQVSEHVHTSTYNDCSSDADVILYTIEGGGHTWPGSINVPRLGPVTNEIDATALIWDFFSRYSTTAP